MAEGVALLERRVRERMSVLAAKPKSALKPNADEIAKKTAEMHQLRAMLKAGTLSQAVVHAALAKAEEELREYERVVPAKEERDLARVIRMLPQAAEMLRERVRGGNLGLRDPRSITSARDILFRSFGGRIPVRPGTLEAGEKPYLVARVAPNRAVLLEAAAGAARCLQSGSGGVL